MMKIDEYREAVQSRLEEITIVNAKQNSDLHNISDLLGKIEKHLETQNSRLRTVEQKSARTDGIVGVFSVVFSALIGWLFKMKG